MYSIVSYSIQAARGGRSGVYLYIYIFFFEGGEGLFENKTHTEQANHEQNQKHEQKQQQKQETRRNKQK